MRLFSLGTIIAITPGISAFQVQRRRCPPCCSVSNLSVASTGQAIDYTESSPRDIARMEEWATACGVQRAEGVQLASDDGYDGFVITSRNLPANSPVVFVPNQMIMSSMKAVQEFGRLGAAEKLMKNLNASDELGYFYLVVKILVEYEKGMNSPWFPWLNSLPRYFSNGASMTPFCFECLPPLVASLAMKERNNLMNLHGVLDKVPFLSDETKNNEDLCKWAFQIAYTRGFETKKAGQEENARKKTEGLSDIHIVPMGDMFNHKADANVELAYDDDGNCHAQTIQDVPAGSSLCVSYGDSTNPSFLFARYGFLDESSPATFCKIMIPHVDTKLEDIGYSHNRMLFYKDTGEVSEEVWDVLLYQILSSSNAKRRRDFYDAHMNADYETKQAFHEHYWPETSAKLLNHLDTFVHQLDQLSAKGNGKDINQHPRLPLILRHNEFVKATFLAVRDKYF